ncbi:hypothetical protein [uncultured Methylobacterium sp.]|uniref:hypothetical protein n=1 Tax=uncultured Methylobacterium sp. TaxID=157278 RepID=UPI0035C9BED9
MLHRLLGPAGLVLILAASLTVGAGASNAQTVRSAGYDPGYGSDGYGFADEAVRGAYIGAPLTRFPSPSQIVPAPWSYGTYGVPTISGIRQAPVAAPSLTVINAGQRPPGSRRFSGARVLSRGTDGGWAQMDAGRERASGVQVIEVQVPRR